MSRILNINKPPPYIAKSPRNNSPSPSPKPKVVQNVVSPPSQNGRQRFMTQDAVNLQSKPIQNNKKALVNTVDDISSPKPSQPIIDKNGKLKQQLVVDKDFKNRKSSIDIGNEENALKTKEQQREAVMKEIEFLQKEVPLYNEVLQDSQASFQGKIDSVDVIELIIIQSLSRWILEHGKPAVLQFDTLKQDAETEIQHMLSSVEELKKKNQHLNVMLQSSEQEKSELKEQYESSNMETMKLKLQLQKYDHNANDMSLRHQDIQDLEAALDASEEKRDQLAKKNQTLQEDLNIIRSQNDELTNKNYGLDEEINKLQKEIKHLKHLLNSQEKRQEQEIKLLTEKYSHLQDSIQDEQEKLTLQATNSAVSDNTKQTLILSSDGDMEFLDGDSKYHDGLDDGPVFTLEGEIQDYEDPDDAWLSQSEDEEEVVAQPTPLPQPIISPKPEFVLEKQSFGVEAAPRMKEFTMEKQSFVQDKMDMSNNFAMQSQKMEIEKEKQEWGNEKLKISEDPEKPEEWGSQSIKISEEPQKKEAWGAQSIKISEEPQKKEAWGAQSIKISEEPQKKQDSWGSQSIKLSEEPQKKQDSWGSQSIKLSEEPQKKQQSWGSQSIKISEEPQKKQDSWGSQSIKISEEVQQQPKYQFGSEKIKMYQEPRKEEFGSEKLMVDQKKQPLQLELSFTQNAQSPSHGPMAFESEKTSDEVLYEKPSFSTQKIRMSKEQEEEARRINIIRLPPPPHIPKEQIIKDYGQDEIITKTNPFSSLMAQWGKIDKEQGGKPKANGKEYELINRWKIDAEKAAAAKAKKAVKSEVASSDDSQNRVVGVVKVTKSKRHTIKPRCQGNLTIIKSTLVPDYRLIKQSNFYFCLDGLPLGTNVNANEPDFAKDRSKDPLVPCLFWFDSEQDYEKLVKEVGEIAVREIGFQKVFAKYAKGVIAFDDKIVADITEEKCIFELTKLLNKKIVLPANLKDKIPKNNLLAFYAINEQQFHRFHATDAETRNKWIDAIRKLVLKRRGDPTQMHKQSVMRSLSTFSSASSTPASSASAITSPYAYQNNNSQEINHRMSVLAHQKMSLIDEVENEMD